MRKINIVVICFITLFLFIMLPSCSDVSETNEGTMIMDVPDLPDEP